LQLMKILVVEDNEVSLELVRDLLEASGYVVLGAGTAEEGIEIAKAENPALILMDLRLPGIDGLTATSMLRNDPSTKHIPIVALTASAMKEDGPRALGAGCSAYLTKPFDTRVFVKEVSALIRACRTR
jgi:CheY-like chemotaxis protein